jgi:hypothetical protein
MQGMDIIQYVVSGMSVHASKDGYLVSNAA